MNAIQNYIIIDDDPFNNMICKIQIENSLSGTEIRTFEIPEEGLSFIQHEYVKNLKQTILFLDINMPTLTCWEFIEEFEKFNEELKKQIDIYILSSSIDPRDKDKTKGNKHIKGFISKPLNREIILAIAGT